MAAPGAVIDLRPVVHVDEAPAAGDGGDGGAAGEPELGPGEAVARDEGGIDGAPVPEGELQHAGDELPDGRGDVREDVFGDVRDGRLGDPPRAPGYVRVGLDGGGPREGAGPGTVTPPISSSTLPSYMPAK